MFHNMLCEYFNLSWWYSGNYWWVLHCRRAGEGPCHLGGRSLALAAQLSWPESSWAGRVRSCLKVIWRLRAIRREHQCQGQVESGMGAGSILSWRFCFALALQHCIYFIKFFPVENPPVSQSIVHFQSDY